MRSETILNNQLVSYLEYNAQVGDTNPALVFLHGWRSSAAAWTKILEAFSSYRIFALDLPGFGNSPAPSKPFTLEDYCLVVTEFIVKQHCAPVVLVGHSFGGRVAIKLSATNPGLVVKLVLVDSHGFVDKSLQKKVFKFAARLVKPIFKMPALANIKKHLYRMIGSEDYVTTPELKETFLNIINEDLENCLSLIHQPTLLVWGQNDKDTPIDFGRRFNEKIEKSKLYIIPQAGHYSFLDNPELFIEYLRAFIV